jgi:hypothetical protein
VDLLHTSGFIAYQWIYCIPVDLLHTSRFIA